MKISYQWLKQWVNVQLPPEVLAEQLTAAGLEIDSCAPVADAFTGVVIAEVTQVERHPHADKLSICEVNIGNQNNFSVVCGAQNVTPGVRVPYATVGAILRQQTPEPKSIQAATLRNVASEGMLCSAADLGLAEISEGLLLLPADAPLGKNIRDYLQLDDTLFDVQLTPNRGDCLSVLGVAREVGAINHLSVKKIIVPAIPLQHKQHLPVTIKANTACLRYAGRVITDINNKASTPIAMQECLRRAGIRCISPVVDVMNYVMLEIGQPLHAFDLSTIDREIQVRFAHAGESITLLDGQTITLDPDVLVIADHQKPLAMAGIMGGLDSGVTVDTHIIFIESAYFRADAIQARARRYGLQTDGSYRFERGVDPLLPVIALERATELLLSIVGGKPGPVVDVNTDSWKSTTIDLSEEQLTRLLGVALPHKEVINILQRLEMRVHETETGWRVQPPSFRFDIHLPEDLIEEIARVYGYTQLPTTPSHLILNLPQPRRHVTSENFSQVLVGRGYQEVITYSFIDPVLQSLCEPQQPALALANPIASDLAVMRTSIWPGLLSVLQYNVNRQQDRVRCFEQGLCFVQVEGELQQQPRLAGIVSGNLFSAQWQKPEKPVDFYAVKADVLALMRLSHRATDFTIVPAEHSALHPGQSAAIVYKTTQVMGYLGAFHPRITHELGIKNRVYGFELQLTPEVIDQLLPRYQVLSRFPSVRRDVAIIVKESILAQQIEKVIREAVGEWLQDLTIFDVYRGESIPPDCKSLAVGLTLQNPERTLTDMEIEQVVKQVIHDLEQQCHAKLRE